MTRTHGARHTLALVVLVVSGPWGLGSRLHARRLADPPPIEVVPTQPAPLPPRFDAVRNGRPLYGANWPWDHYGSDFGANLWGYRGLANQGPAGWRRETRGENQAARRFFWAQREGVDHCLGVQVHLVGGAANSDSSALIFTRFDEAAAQPSNATVNLTNQTIAARVYLPVGIAGPANARSGVMLFFQDINWRWAQTTWMNIETTDTWITITVRGNDLPLPSNGSDALFNRSQVRTAGIKVGANSQAGGFVYSGPFFVDEVSVSVSPDIRFDFSEPDTRTEHELKDFAGLKPEDIPGLKTYVVRWWVVADGRAGLRYDSNGFVTGVDDQLLSDIRELLRLAKSANIYLMPVLLDFLLGAEAVDVDGVRQFGRADLINVPEKRQSLLDKALSTIFDEVADSNEVLAIDLFNEPEWLLFDHPPEFTVPPGKRPPEIKPGGVISLETMRTFFSEIIDLHKQKGKPGKHPLLTVGSASPQWVGLWSSLALDMAQSHLWNGPGQMDEGRMVPVPPPVPGVPNILGEFSTVAGLPQPRCQVLTSGLTNGYSGAFPWGYRAKDAQSLPVLGEETRTCLKSLPRFTFTDDSIVPGTTPVRAVHIKELWVSVDTLRLSCNLEPYQYTGPMPAAGVTFIQAVHFTEPRIALDQLYDCRAIPRPDYPLPRPAPGGPVMGRHLSETRAAALTVK